MRGVFLDISKAFDKVWHEGLIHKLEQNGIGELLLKNLTDLLKSRKQRVVLNVQHSSWSDALASVPQRSILDPLLFVFLSMIYLMVFSVTQTMHGINKATNDLNNDLTKITENHGK